MTAILRIEPRWTDFDAVGHVNNSVYLTYAEEARARLLRDTVCEAWPWLVVVHNSIDYHRPVELTDTVEVTSATEGVGSSSLTIVSKIHIVGGQLCATVRTVQVVLCTDRSRSRPWTEGERVALETLRRDVGPQTIVRPPLTDSVWPVM
jgi:acyl-CoA thioester hydrolase